MWVRSRRDRPPSPPAPPQWRRWERDDDDVYDPERWDPPSPPPYRAPARPQLMANMHPHAPESVVPALSHSQDMSARHKSQLVQQLMSKEQELAALEHELDMVRRARERAQQPREDASAATLPESIAAANRARCVPLPPPLPVPPLPAPVPAVRAALLQRLAAAAAARSRRDLDARRTYTRLWIRWRAHLLRHRILEDDLDDEVYRVMRAAHGLARTGRWGHSRHAAAVPAERYEATLAAEPPQNPTPGPRYTDTTRCIDDPRRFDAGVRERHIWLMEEEAVFVDMFQKLNKDFVRIAAHLPGRSVKEVIKFYYANKKRLRLKRYNTPVRRAQQVAAQRDASLAVAAAPPAAEPKDFGTVYSTWDTSGQRSSLRLTSKPTVNYSERALESVAAQVEGELEESSSESDPGAVEWSELEKDRLLHALELYGADLRAVQRHLKTKTHAQVRAFYEANRDSLSLDDFASLAMPARSPVRSPKPRRPPLSGSGERRKRAAASPAPVTPPLEVPYECTWNDEQRSVFVLLLSEYGRAWGAIAGAMGVDASEVQAYYQHFRDELNLDDLLPEGTRRTRHRGPLSPAPSPAPSPLMRRRRAGSVASPDLAALADAAEALGDGADSAPDDTLKRPRSPAAEDTEPAAKRARPESPS